MVNKYPSDLLKNFEMICIAIKYYIVFSKDKIRTTKRGYFPIFLRRVLLLKETTQWLRPLSPLNVQGIFRNVWNS